MQQRENDGKITGGPNGYNTDTSKQRIQPVPNELWKTQRLVYQL